MMQHFEPTPTVIPRARREISTAHMPFSVKSRKFRLSLTPLPLPASTLLENVAYAAKRAMISADVRNQVPARNEILLLRRIHEMHTREGQRAGGARARVGSKITLGVKSVLERNAAHLFSE
jgi:hypothetical protein